MSENKNRYASRLEPGRSDFSARRKSLSDAAPAPRRPESFFGEEDEAEPPRETAIALPKKSEPEPSPPAPAPDIVSSDLAQLGYGPDEIEEIVSGKWRPPVAGKSVASGVVGKLASQLGVQNSSSEVDGGGEYRGFPLESVVGSVLNSFTKKAKG